MDVYPAIDIRQGKVVRLQEGDPARQTAFAEDPLAVAMQWAGQGAAWLHVVNLDGALGADSDLLALLRDLAQIGPQVQFGGGVRSLAQVEAALAAGAARVVLGTAAVEQSHIVQQAIDRFGPEAIAVGLDARGGRVRVRGWQTDSGIEVAELGRRVKALGVQRVIHTDIERDGLLTGVNAAASASLARACGLRVIASGGVAGPQDIQAVAAVAGEGVEGVILGRALYQGQLTLRQALLIAAGKGD